MSTVLLSSSEQEVRFCSEILLPSISRDMGPSVAPSVFVVVVVRPPFRAMPCISGIMQSVSRQGFLTLRPPPTADAPAAPPPIERVEEREMRDALIVCRSDKLIVSIFAHGPANEACLASCMTHEALGVCDLAAFCSSAVTRDNYKTLPSSDHDDDDTRQSFRAEEKK